MNRRNILNAAAALLSGLIFGLGLALAGMTDPAKVLAFLDVMGNWDPSLLLVLGAAVTVSFVGYRLVLRRSQPLLAQDFYLPTQRRITPQLVAGAALFGIGWGIGGYCPGPAIASLGFANPEALIFLPALLAGNLLHRWQANRRH